MRSSVWIATFFCFNTQPRGGGCSVNITYTTTTIYVSTHSRAEAAASPEIAKRLSPRKFQHTAARRRLHYTTLTLAQLFPVSTHSRAEAAANTNTLTLTCQRECFNTQPRGGGCPFGSNIISCHVGFNTQPRGGGCSNIYAVGKQTICFNTQPRGGGCIMHNAVYMAI